MNPDPLDHIQEPPSLPPVGQVAAHIVQNFLGTFKYTSQALNERGPRAPQEVPLVFVQYPERDHYE
jgi:hypothetical protein